MSLEQLVWCKNTFFFSWYPDFHVDTLVHKCIWSVSECVLVLSILLNLHPTNTALHVYFKSVQHLPFIFPVKPGTNKQDTPQLPAFYDVYRYSFLFQTLSCLLLLFVVIYLNFAATVLDVAKHVCVISGCYCDKCWVSDVCGCAQSVRTRSFLRLFYCTKCFLYWLKSSESLTFIYFFNNSLSAFSIFRVVFWDEE